MSLDTYEIGDSIDIPVTFTDSTGAEASGVPDAMIEIYKANTQIVSPTALTLISGGRFFFPYTIPGIATPGVYTAYITGTVSSVLQTATYTFSVSDRLTTLQTSSNTLQTTTNNIQLDLAAAQLDIDNQLSDLQTDIGDPSVDGTSLHQELKSILDDLGTPLATGQDITEKLDDIRTALGLGTPVGSVAVSGVVIDGNGNPIGNVRVIAVNTATGNASDTNITTNAGLYTVNLNPGTYVFEFIQATTVLQQSLTVIVPPLVSTFTAPTVTLVTKKTITDIVQDPVGTPIPAVLVKAILQANYNANSADNQVSAAAFTNVTGQFSIDLFPGVYIFQFIKTGFDTLPQQVVVV